jgi:hypothetical protein
MGLSDLSSIRDALALVRPCIAFSEHLSRLSLKRSALQSVVRADAIIAAEAKHLISARLNVCSFLAQWKANGWTTSFEERRLLAHPFGRGHAINRRRERRASDMAAAAVPGLERLGLSFREALEISSSAFGF